MQASAFVIPSDPFAFLAPIMDEARPRARLPIFVATAIAGLPIVHQDRSGILCRRMRKGGR